MWRNSATQYGRLNKILHWLVALTVFGLFGLGVWMVSLPYDSSWYNRGPNIHRSIGILLMMVMAARLLLVFWMGKPKSLASHSRAEVVSAKLVHLLIYSLVFAVGLCGYLLSTADGHAIDVFNWFSVPSTGQWFSDQGDTAGQWHQWLAYGLIGIAVLHGLAALKHHFMDKDDTLKRML